MLYLDEYPDEIPDLEETKSVDTSMYDRLGATPASTTVSTDTGVTGDMLNLSMGPPEPPTSSWSRVGQAEPTTPASHSDSTLSDDEQFRDMFNIPLKVPEHQDPTPMRTQGLNFQALLAEAQFKSGRRTLPPPPELRVPKEDKDT